MRKVTPDGHCLFSAVADQLQLLGILPAAQANYTTTRAVAANYILSHMDDFLPFLPSIVGAHEDLDRYRFPLRQPRA